MGGVVRSATGEDKKREAEKAARAQATKLRQERDETARIAGEQQASSKRARRGGLLSEARLGGDQSTLGSVP